MFKVFIVNGMARSGKDTFIQYAIDYLESKAVLGHRFSTIDRVNTLLKELGWDGTTKDEAYRKFASDMKRAWAEYNDGPNQFIYNQVIAEYKRNEEKPSVFFILCREPLEIYKLKKLFSGNCWTVQLQNSRVETITSNESDAAAAEEYEYDYGVTNEGTLEELKRDAELFSDYIVQDFKENGMLIDMTTKKPLMEKDPVVEDAKKYGFVSGEIIRNITSIDTSKYPINKDDRVVTLHMTDNFSEDHATTEVLFRELKKGDFFSDSSDTHCPNRIYSVMEDIILWRPEDRPEFVYTAILEPVYDPDVKLNDPLVIGRIKVVHKYNCVTLELAEDPSKFKLMFNFDDIKKLAEWVNGIK